MEIKHFIKTASVHELRGFVSYLVANEGDKKLIDLVQFIIDESSIGVEAA